MKINFQCTNNVTTGTTALMAASYEGHTDIVEILLNAGVEIDKRDLLGQTALVQSMYGTYADIADMLLIHGASIDAKTKDGNTALMAAVYLGSTSIVQMLIDKHADVNCKNSAGRTPIFLASGVKNNHAIVSMLMKNDADPNMCDDTGMFISTALVFVSNQIHTYQVQLPSALLLAWGSLKRLIFC